MTPSRFIYTDTDDLVFHPPKKAKTPKARDAHGRFVARSTLTANLRKKLQRKNTLLNRTRNKQAALLSTDAHGHEHAPAGSEKGGQFIGKANAAAQHRLEHDRARQAAHKIGTELSREWRSTLEERDHQVLRWFRDGGYKSVNAQLRTGEKQPDKLEQQKADYGVSITNDEMIQKLDSMLDRASLPTGTVVYRGAQSAEHAAKLSAAKVGDKIHEPGYLSTTLNPITALSAFARTGSHTPVVSRIELPKGYHAAYIDDPKEPIENEVIVARGSSYSVTNSTEDVDNHGSTYKLIDLQALTDTE